MRIGFAMSALPAMLLLAGCVEPGPMDLPLKFNAGAAAEAAPDAPRPVARGAACIVFLAEVRDVREDKTSLGSLGRRGAIAVEGKDTEGWVAGAIKASAAYPGITFVESPAAGADSVTLNASLLKAYLSTMNMSKSATVVLKIRYRRGDSDLGEVFYRGDSTGIFWAADKGEMADALNDALGKALAPLRQDISARCRAGATKASAAR